MNRSQFIILSSLEKSQAKTQINASSIREIMEDVNGMDYSYNAIYKQVRALKAAGYVAAGIPDRNQTTYYITAEGQQAIEIIKGGKER